MSTALADSVFFQVIEEQLLACTLLHRLFSRFCNKAVLHSLDSLFTTLLEEYMPHFPQHLRVVEGDRRGGAQEKRGWRWEKRGREVGFPEGGGN